MNMTYQGMRRDDVSRTAQSYILLPNSGNKLPESIEPAQAQRLVQNSTSHDEDDMALLKISDRIHGDSELESQVRGFWMTNNGLLIHGTMNAAFRLTHDIDMKEPAIVEPVSNVVSLGAIREKFAGSVAHYTGHVRKQIDNISSAFFGFAGTSVAQQRTYNEPKLALAA